MAKVTQITIELDNNTQNLYLTLEQAKELYRVLEDALGLNKPVAIPRIPPNPWSESPGSPWKIPTVQWKGYSDDNTGGPNVPRIHY